uniref:Cytochrome P450 n=2 Tax=Coptotermes formosanus TaxID=36987 RepID=R4V471_COPFO|nr:cytochrome P450 [Coptotermes formosanus]
MKYLDMVVNETLRLYPPVAAVDRICVQPYTLKSDPPMEVHPGEVLFIPIVALHHDPKYYPDPERFDPERFSDDNKHNINPLTYLPFGIGPRSCIGNRFALMEAKLALAYLLSRFSVKVVAKTPIPIKIVQKGFNMSIDGGFWLGLEKRTA